MRPTKYKPIGLYHARAFLVIILQTAAEMIHNFAIVLSQAEETPRRSIPKKSTNQPQPKETRRKKKTIGFQPPPSE